MGGAPTVGRWGGTGSARILQIGDGDRPNDRLHGARGWAQCCRPLLELGPTLLVSRVFGAANTPSDHRINGPCESSPSHGRYPPNQRIGECVPDIDGGVLTSPTRRAILDLL